MPDSIELVTAPHNFAPVAVSWIAPGATIMEMVGAHIPLEHRGACYVVLSRGDRAWPVPIDMWGKVRPKPGTTVEIARRVEGDVLRMALLVAVSVFAPYLAGTLLPVGVAAETLALVTAGIGLVGNLLINALIPPPEPQTVQKSDPRYAITGNSNAFNPWGIVPSVLGRHRMYPVLTGRGYTELVGDDVYYRFRAVWSYGTGHLEDLRIGETSITAFSDVEIELRNFDETRTRAAIPELADMDCVFLGDEAPMALYPSDISEVHESVALLMDAPVLRETEANTASFSVDLSLSEGLYGVTRSGTKKFKITVVVDYEYRAVGSDMWIDAGSEEYSGLIQTSFGVSKTITPAAPGKFEVRITRRTEDEATSGATLYGATTLSVIRSVSAEPLPNIPKTCEIALRVKATDQLSGSLQSLNGIFWRHAPVWDGAEWSAPQPVRHPAWAYALAMQGDHLARPVPDVQIDPDDLKEWADVEPHWTCDMVVDQPERLADVLRAIAATGRATPTRRDLKYTIVRDLADGPIAGHMSQRTVSGFEFERVVRPAVHALRMRYISEAHGWQQHELTVYDDGYDAGNATNIETMELRGFVLTGDDTDQGNIWRIGRYHIAAYRLRPEEFTWTTDWEHVRYNNGDKIIVQHDVALFGVGAGRIVEVGTVGTSIAWVRMDERFRLSDGAPETAAEIASTQSYTDGAVMHLSPVAEPVSFAVAGARSARAEDRGAILYLDPVAREVSFDRTQGAAVSGTRRLRLRGRDRDGDTVLGEVTYEAGEVATFHFVDRIDVGALAVGDHVMLEEIEAEPVTLLVRRIGRSGVDSATFSAVAAAPGVLVADQGLIPAYDPQITDLPVLDLQGPALPVVARAVSDETSWLEQRGGAAQPRILVALQADTQRGVSAAQYRLRWRQAEAGLEAGGSGTGNGTSPRWQVGPFEPVSSRYLYTAALQDGVLYEVAVQSLDALGRSRGWVAAGSVVASAYDAPPPDVVQLLARLNGFDLTLSWPAVATPDLRGYEVRYAFDPAVSWDAAQPMLEVPAGQVAATVARRTGHWMVRAVDYSGQTSLAEASVLVAADNTQHRLVYSAELVDAGYAVGFADPEVGAAEDTSGAVRLLAENDAYPASAVWTKSTGGSFTETAAHKLYLLDCEIDAYAEHSGGGVPGKWSVEIARQPEGLLSEIAQLRGIVPGEEFELGGVTLAYLVLRSEDAQTTPVVRSAKWRILEAPRAEFGEVTSSDSSYVEVVFDWPFGQVPQVQVTAKDASDVVSLQVYSVSANRFRVLAYDGAGAPVVAELSWTATGYGQRVNIPASAALPAPPPRYS
ncbi:hypothetical protein SAMN06273572_10256 [Monaibacterium marinum]|uniref:Tip attachment protein J HDII-ins2 domain-containing protein n=1 Tax=Pontivivens marinum TaxID=1690039 RepID=A0A2C9CQ84_9RHOB|nr:hypothetical protein [Monaibacterium marinum]SOH93380.1 hypothetical protein SAMN06273572_10256 [Monaibacterium marinum]